MKTIRELDLRGLRLLDGGLATELERRGFDLSGPLWSAKLLASAPEAIAAVHDDYLEAGADCLMTASYQVSAEGFQALGYGAPTAAKAAAGALRRAVEIAVEARGRYESAARRRSETPRKIWIAASLGSYGAALANGAEYHGNYPCSSPELTEFHRRRLAALATLEADFVAFETIPSLEEARAIAEALRQGPPLPACISFACRDGLRVAHGERLAECAEALLGEPAVIALGINCTPPEYAVSLIQQLRSCGAGGAGGKPIAVYPNSGERWDAERHGWADAGGAGRQLSKDPGEFAKLAGQWLEAGAQWIGGCCRTGPEHIRAIARELSRAAPLPPHATMGSPK